MNNVNNSSKEKVDIPIFTFSSIRTPSRSNMINSKSKESSLMACGGVDSGGGSY